MLKLYFDQSEDCLRALRSECFTLNSSQLWQKNIIRFEVSRILLKVSINSTRDKKANFKGGKRNATFTSHKKEF